MSKHTNHSAIPAEATAVFFLGSEFRNSSNSLNPNLTKHEKNKGIT
jgi:hypothetical protein